MLDNLSSWGFNTPTVDHLPPFAFGILNLPLAGCLRRLDYFLPGRHPRGGYPAQQSCITQVPEGVFVRLDVKEVCCRPPETLCRPVTPRALTILAEWVCVSSCVYS